MIGGRHAIGLLTRDKPRLAAARQHLHARAVSHQRVGEACACVDQVLAIVEHEQHPLLLEMTDERVLRGLARKIADAEHGGHRLRHEARLGQRRELDHPRAIGEAVEILGRDLQAQARLAAAPRADHRHERRLREKRTDMGEHVLPAHERRDLPRQIVALYRQRPERREAVPEVRMRKLMDVLGPREVLELVKSEAAKRGTLRQRVAAELVSGFR